MTSLGILESKNSMNNVTILLTRSLSTSLISQNHKIVCYRSDAAVGSVDATIAVEIYFWVILLVQLPRPSQSCGRFQILRYTHIKINNPVIVS